MPSGSGAGRRKRFAPAARVPRSEMPKKGERYAVARGVRKPKKLKKGNPVGVFERQLGKAFRFVGRRKKSALRELTVSHFINCGLRAYRQTAETLYWLKKPKREKEVINLLGQFAKDAYDYRVLGGTEVVSVAVERVRETAERAPRKWEKIEKRDYIASKGVFKEKIKKMFGNHAPQFLRNLERAIKDTPLEFKKVQ